MKILLPLVFLTMVWFHPRTEALLQQTQNYTGSQTIYLLWKFMPTEDCYLRDVRDVVNTTKIEPQPKKVIITVLRHREITLEPIYRSDELDYPLQDIRPELYLHFGVQQPFYIKIQYICDQPIGLPADALQNISPAVGFYTCCWTSTDGVQWNTQISAAIQQGYEKQ